MALYIILGTLAAIGLLSIVWVCFGWLLPGGEGGILVCTEPSEAFLSRCWWLRELGLLRLPLVIALREPSDQGKMGLLDNDIEICSPETLVSRLEQERLHRDGTGNGDPAGRHQRRGISEL